MNSNCFFLTGNHPQAVAKPLRGHCCLGCAVQLYRFSPRKTNQPPVIAIVIIGSTALITGLNFFPEVLATFRWNRGITGRRVVADGDAAFRPGLRLVASCVNGVAAVVFAPLAERLYREEIVGTLLYSGSARLRFSATSESEQRGVIAWYCRSDRRVVCLHALHRQELSRRAQLFAICGIAGAIVLWLLRDVHGPPTVLRILLAVVMTILLARHRTEVNGFKGCSSRRGQGPEAGNRKDWELEDLQKKILAFRSRR